MELVLDILVTLTGVVAVVLAAWSGSKHFSSDKVPRGSVIIFLVVLVTTILNIYLLWTGTQPGLPEVIGFVMQLLGMGLFAITIVASREARLRMAFDEGNPRGLVRTGPYRYVRHPFYVAYIIYFSGFAIATWSWVAFLPVAILVVIYVLAARMEERLFARTPMATEYEAYKRKTGFFFPKMVS